MEGHSRHRHQSETDEVLPLEQIGENRSLVPHNKRLEPGACVSVPVLPAPAEKEYITC